MMLCCKMYLVMTSPITLISNYVLYCLMYGSYGMGGGYGGMSSYGGYGGGLHSYGSLSSSYGARPTDTTTNNKQKDTNSPNAEKQSQEVSHRKMFFQEWFKMMGGLRSIVELGFAAIALANFWSKSVEIFKKFYSFLMQTSKSFAQFIESKFATKIFTTLATPDQRYKALKTIFIATLRVFAALLICLGIKLKYDIQKNVMKKQKQIEEELKKLKQVKKEQELQAADGMLQQMQQQQKPQPQKQGYF